MNASAFLILLMVGCLVVLWRARRRKASRNIVTLRHSSTEKTETGSLKFIATAASRVVDRSAPLFDGMAHPQWRIVYQDANGTQSTRDIYVDDWRTGADGVTLYECWCFRANERRTFRQDRMISITNIETGRRIKDIAAYRMRY